MAIRPVARSLVMIAIAGGLSACATQAKVAIEGNLDRMVGHSASAYLPNATCSVVDGEYGCLQINRSGCKLWFKVNQAEDLIVGWRYAGPPEICWHFTGIG